MSWWSAVLVCVVSGLATFLLVSPVDQTGPHIQALAAISRLMLNEKFRRQLEQADSVEAVDELLSTQTGE